MTYEFTVRSTYVLMTAFVLRVSEGHFTEIDPQTAQSLLEMKDGDCRQHVELGRRANH